MRCRRSRIAASIIVLLLMTGNLFAEAPARPALDDPFCGLYCAYTVLLRNGIDIDFKQIVIPKYMGSVSGSSMAELAGLLQDRGLSTRLVTGLRPGSLEGFEGQAILWIKSDPRGSRPDHFVVATRAASGAMQIIDPPDPSRPLSYAEISKYWPGDAILVSKGEQPITMVFRREVARFSLLVGAGFVGIAGLFVVRRVRWVKRAESFVFPQAAFAQCAVITLLSAVAAVVYANQASPLLRSVTAPPSGSGEAIPVSRFAASADLQSKMRLGSLLVVDARRPSDFMLGHIEGAINIPFSYSYFRRESILKNVDRRRPVVVYCQSDTCHYSDEVAEALIADGFHDVQIFTGGGDDWVKSAGTH